MESIEFYGEPTAEKTNQFGWPIDVFKEEGDWYRPSNWSFDGIVLGEHLQDVYQKWKSYGAEEVDQFGNLHVRYPERKLELIFGSDFRLRSLRFTPDMK